RRLVRGYVGSLGRRRDRLPLPGLHRRVILRDRRGGDGKRQCEKGGRESHGDLRCVSGTKAGGPTLHKTIKSTNSCTGSADSLSASSATPRIVARCFSGKRRARLVRNFST